MEKQINLNGELPKLFIIWRFDNSDRCESMRVLGFNFEQVQNFILDEFIKEEFKESIEFTDFGLEWEARKPQECFNELSKEEKKEIDYNIYEVCTFCDGCIEGFQIEETEEYTKEDLELKLIDGSNQFYDLTKDVPIKAENWNNDLLTLWKKDVQKGVDALTQLTLKAIKEGKELTEVNL
jgi:hypothetical protein